MAGEALVSANILQYIDVVFWREYAALQQESCKLYGHDYFPLRTQLIDKVNQLSQNPEFVGIYNEVANLPPDTYAFHGTPHANRVLLMTVALAQSRFIEINDDLLCQMAKDAFQHDLKLQEVGYRGHEDPFGQESMVLATKMIPEFTRVGEENKLTGLHQIVDESGVYEPGGKLCQAVDHHVALGYEREEVITAMDIIADVDLLGLGNARGMVALLLEEFRVHNFELLIVNNPTFFVSIFPSISWKIFKLLYISFEFNYGKVI